MATEQLVAALTITALAAAVALVASWASSFQRPTRANPLADESVGARQASPTDREHVHDWQVASREERAGRPRAIFRCSECGALEVREVV